MYAYFIGTPHWTHTRFGLDDRSARRLLARYLRLFYPNGCGNPRGMPRWVYIERVWCEVPYVIPNTQRARVEAFEANTREAVQEFLRIAL